MKSKKMLLLTMLVFVTLLASISFASAAVIPVSDVRVEINDHDVSKKGESEIVLNLKRDRTIEVEVEFEADENADDVRIRAEIVGYEHDRRDRLVDMTNYFNLRENNRYVRTLQLNLPTLMDKGDYTIDVQLLKRNADTKTFSFPVVIDTQDDAMEIRDVIFTPGNSIKAGTSFITNVRLRNIGNEEQDNVKVTVAIPELGRVDAIYIDEIEEEEYKTSEGLVINVPLCADEKKYEVLVLVDYNAFEQEEQKHFITVTKNDACNADSSLTGVKSFNAQAVVGSANSIAGNKVSFPVILSNPSDNSKTVILSPQGADDLGNVKVSPNWVVDLAPFSTMTAYVEVTPANNVAEGEHSFTISATDGTNTKLLNFAVNVKPGSASTASSSSNWVLISVVIVAVLLIIIIIIVLFNKMNNDDEDEEDYY
ncbi:hypothetical protein HOK68_04810 [Candidatus Woesearchaeota archaeon]|jgi:uncharacterized membrane protein|nr:hypothetical protein [Candidatus Woesearchaeota archaeon]MBT4387240.1 hypothetical protein [Candidatus Woesearchaeota archaeon]MBT4596241.1 hypothetical protein [Candidatus Woesearchaeota archaeon]MBT5741536.1 hypothetical protein [Candidatus Woesearchaeota archaeon]MBT6506068.1 hypothetical protein [Candidatus Woesearchaeota archaeon]